MKVIREKHNNDMSHVKAKLMCALLVRYWYRTVGYDVMCFIVWRFSIKPSSHYAFFPCVGFVSGLLKNFLH